ncbi:uncharacterized protein LOC144033086 isoform X5 [Festucalex cinctus]
MFRVSYIIRLDNQNPLCHRKMANNGRTVQRRRNRVTPQKDAEQHVLLEKDKMGLRESFINPFKGRGVVATQTFTKEEFVLEYRGKLCEQGLEQNLERNEQEAVFLFYFNWRGKGWCLDASDEDQSLGRLVNDNHIKPNCKMKVIEVGGLPHLCLFAIRDIAPGEELSYNYGNSDWPWRKKTPSLEAAEDTNASKRPKTPSLEAAAHTSSSKRPKTPSLEAAEDTSANKRPKTPSLEAAEDMSASKRPKTPSLEAAAHTSSSKRPKTPSLEAAEDTSASKRPKTPSLEVAEDMSAGDRCQQTPPLEVGDDRMDAGDRPQQTPLCEVTDDILNVANSPQSSTCLDESPEISDDTDYDDKDYIPETEKQNMFDSDDSIDLCPLEKTSSSSVFPSLANSAIDAQTSEKTKTNTSRKRSLLKVSGTRNQSPLKKSRVQCISESIKVSPPSNSKIKRVYDKRNYCLYCLTPSSKIARHLEAKHADKEEVAKAFMHPKNSQARRDELNILRRRGNYAHNSLIVRSGEGDLQACYRPRERKQGSDFIHCFHCQGLYAKKTIWKHIKICPAKKKSEKELGVSKKRVQSRCALKTAVACEISDGLKTVLSCMIYDEVTRVIYDDDLLLKFGQHLFDLNGSRKNRHDYIRQRLRELGRLLTEARKNSSIRKAVELIYPANFNRVITAVKVLAGHNSENNTYKKPSLALKIGHSLGVLSELIESDSLSSVDRDECLLEYAREFKTIKNFRWKALISRGATTTMTEAKWNAPQILPFTEDVKLLDEHVEKSREVAERMLKLCPSASNYAALAKVTLAQVIIFNRRREGEVSRMELSTFVERKELEHNEDMAACLTPLENKMCEFFTRLEIRGKRGRGVPVLLKPSMVSAMELLAQTREMCGVLKENVFMFGRPEAMTAYRGGECIQKLAKESGAKNPEALTSTRLRKHIATMSQVLNLQENEADQLADFLGHDIRVHRQYYRLPQGTLQLAKMSKMLLAVEQGTLSQYKGQTLDDVQIDPQEKVDSTQDPEESSDEESDLTVPEATGEADVEEEAATSLPSSSKTTLIEDMGVSQMTGGITKRKWTDAEIYAVEKHMMHFIHKCQVPQKLDCLRCINSEPHALKNRTWTGVKNFVRNRITTLKRRASAKC